MFYPSQLDRWKEQWFQQLSIDGNKCCSELFKCRPITAREGRAGYEVLLNDKWHKINPALIVQNYGNPFPHAISSYQMTPLGLIVYCFVPGGRV